jgi:hypothetical protein
MPTPLAAPFKAMWCRLARSATLGFHAAPALDGDAAPLAGGEGKWVAHDKLGWAPPRAGVKA